MTWFDEEHEKMTMDDVKLEALKKGNFTDCSFLVGFHHSDHEIFHGVQATMMMCSPYFAAMLGNTLDPPTFPVRIDFMKPETFKLVLEFLHLGRLKTYIGVKQAVDLVIAADYCLMEPLQNACIDIIKRSVNENTVWASLDQILKAKLKTVADSCLQQEICKYTLRSLQHSTFTSASKASVIFLLEQERLAITDEAMIYSFCLKWAEKQHDMMAAMRDLLPHLRLLTLTPSELSKMTVDVLIAKETKMIQKFHKDRKVPENFPENLCKLTQKRALFKDNKDVGFLGFLKAILQYLHRLHGVHTAWYVMLLIVTLMVGCFVILQMNTSTKLTQATAFLQYLKYAVEKQANGT